MTQNTTGISLKVTKEPQCRHSEHQGFVTYAFDLDGMRVTATCSNCTSSAQATWAKPWPPALSDYDNLKEAARNTLMAIEAPPLVP
jgi:transcription elongation factor Elf1